MQITWLGLSAFEMTIKNPDGEVVLITDPYDNQTGLRFPRTAEGHIVLVSHDEPDANQVSAVGGHPYVIDMPGEYEVRGVFVFGISAPLKNGKENLLLRIEAEGMTLAHLGALDRSLTDEELKRLSSIDILMVPIGGAGVLSPSDAADVIAQIEPRVVIPMTHHLPNLKTKYETIEAFCKQMGTEKCQEMNKYKVTRKDLPEEDMEIITLTR